MTARIDHPDLPSRIVVRGTNWVGDTVISLPAAKLLRRAFPDADFTFWVPAGLADLVRATRIPSEVVCFDANTGGPTRRVFRMGRVLSSGRYDLAVLFQNAFESAFTSWLARIPLRAGYATDLRGPLLNMRVPMNPDIRSRHQVFYYLAVAEFVERHFSSGEQDRPREPDCSIDLDVPTIERAAALLSSRGAETGRPFFVLCPGSVNSEAKRWPGDLYARLADHLISRLDAQVVFLGAPEEKGLIDDILGRMHHRFALNLAGQADILTSMGIMNLSRLVISNDTGSAHLAVAARARVLTIFGPTVAGATAPYGPDAHFVRGQAPCAPCRHFRCPLGGHPCMRSIDPETVLRKTEQILEQRQGL